MNWIELKALNALFTDKAVKLNDTLSKSAASGEFNFLINSLKVLDRTHNQIHSLEGFENIYKERYSERFELYKAFLINNNLLKPQTRIEESDLQILMNIKSWRTAGSLEELRKQIIASDESLRGVSLMFFKNDKYLDNKPSLINALKQVLDVEHFSKEKDQQYIYKLECHHPQAIVLCENLDFLTKPNKPRQHGIELWYAGGKNVSKLDYADTRGLPIYYSCDWDYDGLVIIYPLVKQKIPSIQLLTPNGIPRGINETDHKSIWGNGLKNIVSLLDNTQRKMLEKLMMDNKWIVEESNDLLKMVPLTANN
ncbi:MAG: hypothetical protein BGO69_18860 [Bacteroidetes bacterium 46-16]|nr:MAG: hypothetical protein BGO69_18860 [Bacteroidetes bacterium 46-16]